MQLIRKIRMRKVKVRSRQNTAYYAADGDVVTLWLCLYGNIIVTEHVNQTLMKVQGEHARIALEDSVDI